MKKKLLAILLGAIISLTCVSAFVACTGGNGKGGGNQEESGGTNDKTTVDNFDEWYAAIMDTINSDNYTIHADYSNSNGENDIGDFKRQGNNFQTQGNTFIMETPTNPKPIRYGVIGEEIITTYSYQNVAEGGSSSGKWVPNVYEAIQNGYGAYFDIFQFKLSCFAMCDNGISMAFTNTLIQYTGNNMDLKDEESLKASAAVKYEEITYDEEEGSYSYNVVMDEANGFTATFKFLNGKISYLYVEMLQGNWWTKGTYTFTYGGVSGTIPDEVLSPKTPEEPTEPKTTVDNFDEWYQALRDTITAENYTVKIDYSDSTQKISHDIINGKRNGEFSTFEYKEGNTYWTHPTVYREIADTAVTTYSGYWYINDQTKSYWNKTVQELPANSDFVSKLYNDILFGPFADEFSMPMFSLLLGFSLDTSAELTEAGMKASANSVYEAVSYNQSTSEYTYQNNTLTYILKFKDGKIDFLKITNSDTHNNSIEVIHTFTYGDAPAISIPEEVKTSAALTETLLPLLTELKGTYTYEKGNSKYELELNYFVQTVILNSNGNYTAQGTSPQSQYIKWEVISADKVIIVFEDDTKAELKIGDNCLIYTDKNGTEYTFAKTEQE